MPGKKSASWQLVVFVMWLKTIQSDKKQREIAKIKIAGNIRLTSKVIFFVAIVIEIFQERFIYTYMSSYAQFFRFPLLCPPCQRYCKLYIFQLTKFMHIAEDEPVLFISFYCQACVREI